MGEIEGDLRQFGERVSKDIYQLHLEAEKHPPELEKFDAWGNRIDKLITCEAWKQMKNISATEGFYIRPENFYFYRFKVVNRCLNRFNCHPL